MPDRSLGGSRAANNDPHPRAPGALALSLTRARDLEKQGEGKRGVEAEEGGLRKSSKKETRRPRCHLGRRVLFCGADLVTAVPSLDHCSVI